MSTGLFDDRFVELLGFGGWAEPPDAVPLRILGLEVKPDCHDAVRSAFRARLVQVHPDVAAYTDPGLAAAAEGVAAGRPEVRELVWARDVLLRKIVEKQPPGVTDKTLAACDAATRYERAKCKACNGERRDRNGNPYDMYGALYYGWVRWAGYCWPCAEDAEKDRHRQRRADARANRRCTVCAATFTPPRSDAVYCSPACRQRAHRRRAHQPEGATA